jgi:hypothetical protein
MEDKCENPQELSMADIFKDTQDLMKSLGADEKCVKAATTFGQNNSTSGKAYVRGSTQAGYGAIAAEGEAGAAFQNSSFAFQNAMNESGCGTYVVNATKQSTNIKKVQCSIQKAENQSEVGVNASNNIKILTKGLTPEENSSRERLLALITSNYADSNPKPTINYDKFIEKGLTVPDSVNEAILKQQKLWEEGRQSLINGINRSYSRDLNMTNTTINQTITGKIKLISSLSAQETQNIESATKAISKSVAEQEIAQKSGLNALSPNIKSITDTNIQSNENISGTAINSKIQSIKQQITASNDINIEVAGSINMENVKFDQNIILDVAAESIIASAIQAGMKAATEIITDTASMTKIKTESAGLEDLVKAQGEANAAAISAATISPFGPPTMISGGILGVLIALGGGYILLTNPVVKNIILGVVVIVLVVSVIMLFVFWNDIIYFIKNVFKIKTPAEEMEEKLSLMKRSVKFYNTIWSSFGCTKELTYDDIISLNLEKISSNNELYDTLEYIFNSSLVPNAKQRDIDLCFIEKEVPDVFLPKIKIKKPIDLSEQELKEIWTNYNKFEMDYFTEFYNKWTEDKNKFKLSITTPKPTSQPTYSIVTFSLNPLFSDVVIAITNFVIKKIKDKLPANLTEKDMELLWYKHGNCKSEFNEVKIDKYKKLSSMTLVLDNIIACKKNPS